MEYTNTIFKHTYKGINITGQNNSIYNSIIKDCYYGVSVDFYNGYDNYKYNNLLSCKVYNNTYGVSFSRGGLSFQNNLVYDNDIGFSLGSSSHKGVLQFNSIYHNQTGIKIYYQDRVEFKYNNLYENSDYNFYLDDNLNFDAKYNYWGTTNMLIISDMVYDYDDRYTLGKVILEPFLIAPFSELYAVASKNSGTYIMPIEISLSVVNSNCEIYYSTDGSDPTLNSIRYEGSFILSKNTVLKTVSKKDETWGEILEYQYTFNITPSDEIYTINKIYLTNFSGNALTTIPSQGKFLANVELVKNCVSSNNGYIIIATYSSAGMLVDYGVMSGAFNQNQTLNFATTITQNGDISKIKAFVWDGLNTMQPLSNVVEY